MSGFLIRKYLNPEQTNTTWNQSSQNWIDIRYAEVLLNRAEAAAELFSAGVTVDDLGKVMLTRLSDVLILFVNVQVPHCWLLRRMYLLMLYVLNAEKNYRLKIKPIGT